MIHKVSNTEESQLLQKMIIEDAQRELLLETPTLAFSNELERKKQEQSKDNLMNIQPFRVAVQALDILESNKTAPTIPDDGLATVYKLNQQLVTLWYNINGEILDEYGNVEEKAQRPRGTFEGICGTTTFMRYVASAVNIIKQGISQTKNKTIHKRFESFCEVLHKICAEVQKRQDIENSRRNTVHRHIQSLAGAYGETLHLFAEAMRKKLKEI